MAKSGSILAACVLTMAGLATPALAGSDRSARVARTETVPEAASPKARLETAVEEYKTSLRALAEPYARLVAVREAHVARMKELFEGQVVSRVEVEKAERELAEARAKVAGVEKDLAEADGILHEAEESERLARLPLPRVGSYIATPAVIRYHGSAWHISNIGKVQSFFAVAAGRALPVSAFGQTTLHSRLGYDHTNAVDVPIHPDTAEGRALIAYLRDAGIPFLAFRGAIPGKATGPHIHIGFPSSRFR